MAQSRQSFQLVLFLTLLTVTIAMMYSLARVIYAISKDGLLPQFMSKIDEKRHTPKNATYVAGFF